MKSKILFAAALSFLATSSPTTAKAADATKWPKASIEIFRLAPGKHEAFMREIARYDEVLKAGGQPPLKIFVHDEGAEWDVIIYKPEGEINPNPAQSAKMAARSEELHVETGPAYFVHLRKLVATHTDSTAIGPISAGEWLKELDAWRAKHPARAE
jgi:hypothetical protein